jgi:hypothetical protein
MPTYTKEIAMTKPSLLLLAALVTLSVGTAQAAPSTMPAPP